jgi:hypothetical protein
MAVASLASVYEALICTSNDNSAAIADSLLNFFGNASMAVHTTPRHVDPDVATVAIESSQQFSVLP